MSSSHAAGAEKSPFAKAVAACLSSLGLPQSADGPGCASACLLAGKRAPELAQGLLQKRLREFVERVRPDVIMDAAGLAADEQERIISDFNHGTGFIDMTMNRTSNWATGRICRGCCVLLQCRVLTAGGELLCKS